MDEDAPKDSPQTAFNKLDLSQLQGFSFGTQWTQDKESAADRGRSDHARRDDRREGPGGGGAPDRRDRRVFRKPAGEAGAEPPRDAGGPRREPAEFRGGPRRTAPNADRQDRAPYDSPYFATIFYPEDASFTALVRTIRTSARTIELFEIARTVIGKPERFVAVVSRRQAPTVAPGSVPAQPLHLSVPDGLPFESEEAAIAHVVAKHLGLFFDAAEVEVDPPKGNFQVVNRCGITGEILAPPNYHKYAQISQQHYAARLGNLSSEAFRSRIESVRDPLVIQQWLDKMKKVTRYTSKQPPAEGASPLAFDSMEEARTHLLSHSKDKIVRETDSVRFHGKAIENLPQGEIRRAVEGALERQRRFPLDTANLLRGRLRREHFTIFKKGSKGVSYVCAVKRKFRVPGQVFSDSINGLITFIEGNPMMKAGDLGARFLGLGPAEEGAVPTAEEREKAARMLGDLGWLVREGYVTEFIDGRLYAPPPMVEARKKEVEADIDPENFPEAVPESSVSRASDAPASEAPATEAPSTTQASPPSEGAAASEEPSPAETPLAEAPIVEAAPMAEAVPPEGEIAPT